MSKKNVLEKETDEDLKVFHGDENKVRGVLFSPSKKRRKGL